MAGLARPFRRPSRRLALAGPAALALALGLTAAPPPALASDPFGVYVMVDEVTIEPPKADEPLKVRIDGVVALSYRPTSGNRGGVYTDPARGYLYFACPSGQEETCQLEWADLVQAKGGPRCASFGDRYLTDPEPNGRLRLAAEAPSDPDIYPIAQGVTLTEHGFDNTCDAIKKFIADGGVAMPTDAPTEAPTVAPLATTAVPGSFVPAVAQEGQAASSAQEPVPADDGEVDGGGSGPVPMPGLALMLVVGLGALGLIAAAAWSRQPRS